MDWVQNYTLNTLILNYILYANTIPHFRNFQCCCIPSHTMLCETYTSWPFDVLSTPLIMGMHWNTNIWTLYYTLYPFSVHVVTFTFHYQLMHLLIKTLSRFTFKTTHVKKCLWCVLKINLKNPTCFGQSSDHHQGSVAVPYAITTCQPACFVAFQFVAVCCLYVYTCDVPVGVVSGCVLDF